MSDSWREADTGYVVYTATDAEAQVAYCPDGVGLIYFDSPYEMNKNAMPRQIVRVGIETWERHYE